MDMFGGAFTSETGPASGRNTSVEERPHSSRRSADERNADPVPSTTRSLPICAAAAADKALAEDVYRRGIPRGLASRRPVEGRSTVVTWILAIARRKILAARINPAASSRRDKAPTTTRRRPGCASASARSQRVCAGASPGFRDIVKYRLSTAEHPWSRSPQSSAFQQHRQDRMFHARKRLADE